MIDQDETKKILSKIGQKKKKKITYKAVASLVLLIVLFAGIYQLTNRTVQDINEIADAGFPKIETIKQLNNIQERPVLERGLYIENIENIEKIENKTTPPINRPRNSRSLGYKIQEIQDPKTGLILEKVIPDEQ